MTLYAILGTGMVARVLAEKLTELGHEVTLGTRDPEATRTRTEPDYMGNPPYFQWAAGHLNVRLADYRTAAAEAEFLINAVNGQGTLPAIELAGQAALAGKTLLDVSLPLDASQGMPPRLTVCNDDSLGEQVQRELPKTRVVKTLAPVFFENMVDPAALGSQTTVFLSGDSAEAKTQARGVLKEFGWSEDSMFDLGDITTARAVEMYARLYFTMAQQLGTFEVSINVVSPALNN